MDFLYYDIFRDAYREFLKDLLPESFKGLTYLPELPCWITYDYKRELETLVEKTPRFRKKKFTSEEHSKSTLKGQKLKLSPD